MAISAPVLVFFLSLHQLCFMVVLVSWLTLHNAMVAVVLFRHSARRRRIRSLTHRPLFTPGWSLQEFAVIHGLECTAPPTKRAVWMRERCQDWWDRIVATNFNDNDWRENFRMSRHNFCHLVAAVAPFMSPCENYVRIPVPLDKRVAMALYKLASCGEYGIVANRFGVHKSTVKKFFYMFCQSVTTHLAKEYVKLPSANEAKKIAERFEAKCHLPQIFGAIDGTHIPIAAPKTGYRDFVNRKHWASYNVQAVVDDGGLFMNVSCRAPGSAHDSTALKMSALYKRSDNLVPHGFSMLRGTAIPFMLVGDPAYPLLPWIMKGYTGKWSTNQQAGFGAFRRLPRNPRCSEVRLRSAVDSLGGSSI
ncbi:uncharacterized protein LOC119176184 isoform X2 [Rhipicephalus microplus]|uniref:uncharacterized protein LOC119176184 isoform X2 n=1 Tax=Rhipicephalus microplus TaxID=6941 RepID=UPI003F6D3BD0